MADSSLVPVRASKRTIHKHLHELMNAEEKPTKKNRLTERLLEPAKTVTMGDFSSAVTKSYTEMPEKRDPFMKRFVESTLFESIMGVIICLNCFTIGLQVHLCPPSDSHRRADSCPSGWIDASEHVCVAIFIGEFFLRGCFEGFRIYNQSWVMRADVVLVWVVGVGCSWIIPLIAPRLKAARILTALRAFRLIRILRVVRFQFRDMWRLFLGMARSSKTLISMICVVVFVNYIFGIVGVVLIGDDSEMQDLESGQWFGGLDEAMFTLVQIVTGDSWATQIARPIMSRNESLWIFFISYIAVGTLVLMNLMTAIIVENAMEMSKEDEEHQLHELDARKDKEFRKLRRVFLSLDANFDGTIDAEEFEYAFCNRPDIMDKFKLLGFSEKDYKQLFKDLDDGTGALDIDVFLEGIEKMQGWAKSKDLVRTQKSVERLQMRIEQLFEVIDPEGASRQRLGIRMNTVFKTGSRTWSQSLGPGGRPFAAQGPRFMWVNSNVSTASSAKPSGIPSAEDRRKQFQKVSSGGSPAFGFQPSTASSNGAPPSSGSQLSLGSASRTSMRAPMTRNESTRSSPGNLEKICESGETVSSEWFLNSSSPGPSVATAVEKPHLSHLSSMRSDEGKPHLSHLSSMRSDASDLGMERISERSSQERSDMPSECSKLSLSESQACSQLSLSESLGVDSQAFCISPSDSTSPSTNKWKSPSSFDSEELPAIPDEGKSTNAVLNEATALHGSYVTPSLSIGGATGAKLPAIPVQGGSKGTNAVVNEASELLATNAAAKEAVAISNVPAFNAALNHLASLSSTNAATNEAVDISNVALLLQHAMEEITQQLIETQRYTTECLEQVSQQVNETQRYATELCRLELVRQLQNQRSNLKDNPFEATNLRKISSPLDVHRQVLANLGIDKSTPIDQVNASSTVDSGNIGKGKGKSLLTL